MEAQLHPDIHVLERAEDDVPRARDIQLPPERVGQDRADRQPLHRPLRSVPPDTHLHGPAVVAQVASETRRNLACEACGGKEKNIYLLLLLLLTSIDLPRRFQTITLDRESGLETRRVRGCALYSHVGVVGLTMRWLVDFGRWMHLTSVPLLCGAELSEGALEWLEL